MNNPKPANEESANKKIVVTLTPKEFEILEDLARDNQSTLRQAFINALVTAKKVNDERVAGNIILTKNNKDKYWKLLPIGKYL